MANARWIADNLVWDSGVTLTASAEATGYPVTNLLSADRNKVWRSSVSTGNQTVTCAFAGSVTIQAIALVNGIAHTGGAIKAEYWNGSSWLTFDGGTGLFVPSSSNRTRLVVLWNSSGVTTTQVRLTFVNTAAVSEAVELGVAFLGAYLEPATNVSDAASYVVNDPSLISMSEGGQRRTWLRQKYLTLQYTYDYLDASDKDALLAINDAIGVSTPIVFALDPDDAAQVAYGFMPAQVQADHDFQDQWNVTVQFEEAR